MLWVWSVHAAIKRKDAAAVIRVEDARGPVTIPPEMGALFRKAATHRDSG